MGPRLRSGSPGPRLMGDCCSPRDSGWVDAWTVDRLLIVNRMMT